MIVSVAALLESALGQAAGVDARPASISIEYGPAAGSGARLSVTTRIERATRSLVFAHGEARSEDGAIAATASAVFRRVAVAEPAQNRPAAAQ